MAINKGNFNIQVDIPPSVYPLGLLFFGKMVVKNRYCSGHTENDGINTKLCKKCRKFLTEKNAKDICIELKGSRNKLCAVNLTLIYRLIVPY